MKTTAKLLVIINSIYGLHKHLNTTPAHLSPERIAEGRWRFTLALEGLTNEGEIGIDPDEFGLFVDGGDLQFAMELSLLARRHSAAVEMMKVYARKRQDLLELMPPPYQIDGVDAVVALDPQQAIPLVLRGRALEAMLAQMLVQTDEDKRMADDIRDKFGPIVRRILNDQTFPKLGAPSLEAAAGAIDTQHAAPPAPQGG